MKYKGAQQGRFALQGTSTTPGSIGECNDVRTGAIRERVVLEVSPDVFDGVEFRGVRRQEDRADATGVAHEILDHLGAVGVEPVPDENHRSGMELAAELPQKRHDPWCVDIVVGVEPEIQLHVVAGGGHAQSGDGGDFLMVSSALVENRGLPPGTPTAPHQGRHEKAGFVEENEVGLQACGVFFTRGQSCLTHRWMCASSRSTARRAGFCGLKPSPCNKRPT